MSFWGLQLKVVKTPQSSFPSVKISGGRGGGRSLRGIKNLARRKNQQKKEAQLIGRDGCKMIGRE
jgi:hypothetical protein